MFKSLSLPVCGPTLNASGRSPTRGYVASSLPQITIVSWIQVTLLGNHLLMIRTGSSLIRAYAQVCH